VPHQDIFLAPLPGIEEEEAPTSTTFSHVNYAPAEIFSELDETSSRSLIFPE
jgi:hypothetical protein